MSLIWRTYSKLLAKYPDISAPSHPPRHLIQGPLTSIFFIGLLIYFLLSLLYKVVLVSGVQQTESAICIHISPPT